ncbi:FadR/GntR family transcriptional regulator [Marinimicrobium sp. ARAG 43.8]|uniref:FadR/GntR family transcriptional regulator n=1 Tax=Marinimicrobium sp. ARAG 43.8 TaxID=3418719 RepID=UPI003CF7630D
MQFEAIKPDRLYIKVANQLSQLISDGKIEPGQKFPAERELAERLGVSRPTIREAMIALELQGVIEIRTGSGIYVTRKKPRLEVRDKGIGPFEILETRMLLETEACALAAERISDEQIEKLWAAYREMEEENKKQDASEQADWKFHNIIAMACQNTAIYAVVDWLWELRNQSELHTAFSQRIRQEGVHPILEDHRTIIEALANRDAEGARQAMRKHLENATEAAATHFGQN